MIYKYQHKDKELVYKLKQGNYQTKYSQGGKTFTQIICRSKTIL